MKFLAPSLHKVSEVAGLCRTPLSPTFSQPYNIKLYLRRGSDLRLGGDHLLGDGDLRRL